MNNPLKIIHKYKNNNRRIQYLLYILVGSQLSDDIINILNSIKNKTFYDSINLLSKKNLDLLQNFYGKYWYKKLFISVNLNSEINLIKKNTNNKQSIINKLGKEWYKIHIDDKIEKKKKYSFADNYYDYLVARNKLKVKSRKVNIDFRTYMQKGGSNVITDENIDDKIEQEDNEENNIETVEDLDDEVIEQFDFDELSKLYSMENIEQDKKIKERSKLISEAINDKKWEKKNTTTNLEFNNKYEELTYDSNLEEIYEKIYIFDEYIFSDDTINVIKNKIATVIPLNNKFGKNINLIPEYQYLWTEYKLNDNIDQVMIGQKWIRRNELLKIDIKPNNTLKPYENLSNNLSYLRDSFGIKIKREDDSNNILSDYDEFMTNNEIYMVDLFNELGISYNVESQQKKNLFEVYINIYFPFITIDRLNNIFDLLNNNNEKELDFNNKQFTIINNDTKLEKEIYEIVESTKKKKNQYEKFFNDNYIIQSIIHVNLKNIKNITGTVSEEKIDLYKIFDNFVVSKDYPFVQYQTPDSQLTYKFFTKTKNIENKEILNKWFENAPYGISFKIKVDDNKYISINLHENVRIEYKITWKEEDKATIDNIKESYKYVNNLLLKINNENKKIKLILPDEDKYKYAFINTILKFSLPNKNKINHNDLSEFSRYFFPYIALIIEPKKRQSKKKLESASSKYGTYLRYKRISNFENELRMQLRILYFLRNFDIPDKELILEVSKQFNITEQIAAEKIDNVREKYGKVIQKSSKMLKKFKKLPKGKPPGVGIDIQGRSVENYKIRIAGARSKEQLDDILSFIQILLFLYNETYFNKITKYQNILIKLKKLTNIAKRRNKVTDSVEYDQDKSTVKEVTALDKKRLGFKPEEGQNQWTRSCQNSGDDKKRQPIITNNLKDLLKKGYKLNAKSGYYEKPVNTTIKGKKYNTVVRAIKLYGDNNTFNYFTCNADHNNEHMYVGFLSKSNNPDDLCMPCCFKKDQLNSANKIKKNYFLKCTGEKKADNVIEQTNKELGDKIYILQETNKVQEGRFLYLSSNINFLFNDNFKNDKKIKNHYLIESNSGYYFKYTVKDNNYNFLALISNLFNMTIDDIKEKLINILKNDKNDTIFTYLNNGDLKTSFKTRDAFIDYINNSIYLEYDILGELIELPGVFSSNGLFLFILEKNTKIIKKDLEKDITEDFYIIKCLNYENKFNIDENRDFIFIIKEGKYYFPIYKVKKRNKIDKNIILKKIFNNSDTKELINIIKNYYSVNCFNNFLINLNISKEYSCKFLTKILKENNIDIKNQFVDKRNKCKYLELDNYFLLPVTPSGTSVNYNIKEIKNINNSNLKDIDYNINKLKKINKVLEEFKLDTYIPVTIFYNSFQKDNYFITSLLLKNNLIIPIKNQYMSSKQFKKYGLNYEFQTKEELIDIEILNNIDIYDESKQRVNTRLHKNEGYNLYRLELSNYLSLNIKIKNNIINIVKSKEISIKQKKKEIEEILFNIIKTKTKSEQFYEILKKKIDLVNFDIKNIRNLCNVNREKNSCNSNFYCFWNDKRCVFSVSELYIIEYIKRIIEEFILNGIKYKELIQENQYYVSDIVDNTQYSNRPNQKIIKTTNFNIKKILEELFGKNRAPKLGKRYINNISKNNTEEEEIPKLEIFGKMLIQEVISNQNSVIRAFVNSYFWINNKLYDSDSRNLGFNSALQTELTNLFKAHIIDYLQNNIENIELTEDLKEYYNNKNINLFLSSIKSLRKNNFNTNGKIELILLSYMYPYPIIVYNNYNEVIYIYSSGPVKVNEKTIKKYLENKLYSINIKFYFETSKNNPYKIYSIYYK